MTGPTFCSHHRELDQPEKQADNRKFQRYKTITVAGYIVAVIAPQAQASDRNNFNYTKTIQFFTNNLNISTLSSTVAPA
jgi:hypothetical protein